MASITTAALSADLNHALGDFPETLTVVLPSGSAGSTYSATRQAMTNAFVVEDNGRETMIDVRFFINGNGVSTMPSKGWVVDDGATQFKVETITKDAAGVCFSVECSARYQA